MRWNCPHCRNPLAAGDDQLSSDWLFSRCFHCGGHFLVRLPEVSVVKVDKIPDGEKVLAIAAVPPAALGDPASQGLAQHLPPRKAVIRPVTQRRFQEPPRPAGPVRLPEIPAKLRRKPVAAVEDRANRPPFQEEAAARPEALPPAAPPVAHPRKDPPPAMLRDFPVPEPLPELSQIVPSRPKLLPIVMGIAGAVMVGSGIYIYIQDIQGQAVLEKAPARSASPAGTLSKTRTVAPPPAVIAGSRPTPPLITRPAAAIPGPANILASGSIYTDRVHHLAMAPDRSSTVSPEWRGADETRDVPMVVRVRSDDTRLLSGPANRFSIVAIVDRNARLVVTDWNEGWFKVQLPDMNAPDRPSGTRALPKIAWVPTEGVQVIPTAPGL